MNWLIVVLRFLHVFFGVFWAGSVFTVSGFVLRAAEASGPEGGRFMSRLTLEKGLTPAMLVSGGITVLAGLMLLWHDSAGFNGAFMGSGMGIALSIGGLAAILALGVGIRTAMGVSRLGAVMKTIASQGASPDPTLVARAQQGQRRMKARARAIAILLAIAVLCMAAARYVVF